MIGIVMTALAMIIGGTIGYFFYKDDLSYLKKRKKIIDVDKEIFKAFELYQEKQKYEEAFKIFMRYAKVRESLAQYYLAEMYLDDSFVRKNDKKAFTWAIKSANLGNKEAIILVSKLFKEGIGTKINIERAKHYINKANLK